MGAAQVVAQSADAGDTTTASAAELSDGELVAAHLDGDRQAFEALYERYHPRLLAFCRYRTKTQQNAEDVAHDVIVRALTYLEGFDRDRPMWPWLKQIATNALADHYRSSSREVDRPDEALDGADPEANEHTVWLAERDALLQAMDSLSPRDRSVLKLKYGNDWDSEELQDLLDVERSALYKILQRARNRLHSTYEELADSKLAGLLPAPWVARLRGISDRIRARLAGWEANLAVAPNCFEALASAATAVAIGVGLAAAGVAFDAPAVLQDEGLTRTFASTAIPGQMATSPDPPESFTWSDGRATTESAPISRNPADTSNSRGSSVSASISSPETESNTAPALAADIEGGTDERGNISVVTEAEGHLGEDEIVSNDRDVTVNCTESPTMRTACDVYDEADEAFPDATA